MSIINKLGVAAIALPVAVGGLTLTATSSKAASVNEYFGIDYVNEFVLGTYKDDSTADSAENNPEIYAKGEVHFKGQVKTDSGLTIGGEIEFTAESDATNNIDEIYAYVSGDFGRLEVGDQDGAADNLDWSVPKVGFGQVDGDYNNFAGNDSTVNLGESSDDTKITYYLPKFGNLALGISWAPLDDEGSTAEITSGEETDQIEVGAKYSMGDITLNGAYYQATDNDAGAEDHSTWSVGFTYSFGDFKVGAGHANNGASGQTDANADVNGTTLGATYSDGAMAYGFSVNQTENSAATGQDQDTISFGAEYTFEPVVNDSTPVTAVVAADLTMFDRAASTNGATAGDDGWVAILYTSIEF